MAAHLTLDLQYFLLLLVVLVVLVLVFPSLSGIRVLPCANFLKFRFQTVVAFRREIMRFEGCQLSLRKTRLNGVSFSYYR